MGASGWLAAERDRLRIFSHGKKRGKPHSKHRIMMCYAVKPIASQDPTIGARHHMSSVSGLHFTQSCGMS